ncbi:MAG: hypothetical protein ACXACC_11155, partial [Promethearchaeota archaeon]
MKIIRYIFVVLMLMCSSLFVIQVTAHPPENIELTYDISTNNLTVIITHNTADPNSHYVEKVEIYKNNIEIQDEDYTSQPTADTFTLTFFVEAVEGDILKVEATDNLGGKTEEEITVTNGNDNNPPSTPTISGPTSGKPGIEYDFTFISIDPDNDNIFIKVSWGC